MPLYLSHIHIWNKKSWNIYSDSPGNPSINSHGYFPTGLMGDIFVLENLPGLSQALQHLYLQGTHCNQRDEHAPSGPCHPTNTRSYWLHLGEVGMHPSPSACDSAWHVHQAVLIPPGLPHSQQCSRLGEMPSRLPECHEMEKHWKRRTQVTLERILDRNGTVEQYCLSGCLVSETQACCSHFMNGRKIPMKGKLILCTFFFFFSFSFC